MLSHECLTIIDHDNPGDNNVYITCDTSNWFTGAILSFGPTWESAHPIAFNSMQLKGAEQNYPVHEKELLAIICVLKKWHSDLLGMNFVYTNHHTLENFDTQWDLSQHQLQWQEFLSQYDFQIIYIPGEANSVADTLSHVPPDAFPDELHHQLSAHVIWSDQTINAILQVTTDHSILKDIQNGYLNDDFCKKVARNQTSIISAKFVNGLWYISDCLLIPQHSDSDIWENLFCLAHDTAGHFGADKSYVYYKTHTTGPICSETSRNCTFLHVSNVDKKN